jgi:hypothetical protein
VFYSPRRPTDLFHQAAHQSSVWRIFIQAKTSNVCASQIIFLQKKFHKHIKTNKMRLKLPPVFPFRILDQPAFGTVSRGQQVFRALRRKIRGQHINFYSRVIHNAKYPIKSQSCVLSSRPPSGVL